jgi:replicative DNA helicase
MAHPEEPLTRTPPCDLNAERSVLGACMLSARACREVLDVLNPASFYRPAHTVILNAIGRMHAQGLPVDPITLGKFLADAGELTAAGGASYLHSLASAVPTAANADYYAGIVEDRALRRALIEYGTRLIDAAYQPDGGDTYELVEHAVAQARDIRDRGQAAQDAPVQDVHDFLAVNDTGYDWVLPGLLEHGDRVIWTAGEGGGKSVLQRQLAVTAAAGAMPFTPEPNALGPQKVLVLDCENSDRQTRRHYRGLMNLAERMRTPVKRGQLHIDVRPEGVDLTRPDGRAWLMRRVEKVMPDLLIVGPIYRLHTGDPNSEEHARKVTVVLDEARATARCCLSLEAHSPQGNGLGPRTLRPVGSSLWLRWPEFGMGLRPVEDEKSAREDRARRLITWRGARDERQWPQYLRQGWEHQWPWHPYQPSDADKFTGYSPTGATS